MTLYTFLTYERGVWYGTTVFVHWRTLHQATGMPYIRVEGHHHATKRAKMMRKS